MNKTTIRLSDVAVSDILEQFDWYQFRVGETLAKRWEKALTAALLRIIANPQSGALCAFKADELQSIRRIPIARFPKHLIFYRANNNEILVLRVIHGARFRKIVLNLDSIRLTCTT